MTVETDEKGKFKKLRIYTCDGCGKEAIAGSKELLEEWTKGGTILPDGTHLRWHRCGGCS